MTIDIEALRKAAMAATPGPWQLVGTVEQVGGEYEDIIPTDVDCMTHCYGGSPVRAKQSDLEFIAAANPAAILELIAQRDALLTALERFIDSHEECTDFDGFTAQIVCMDDYHEAQEALTTAKGTTA